jgi:hypothetical protein
VQEQWSELKQYVKSQMKAHSDYKEQEAKQSEFATCTSA